ncbi:Drebrin-like protein [Cladorrhinum sp. PSN259]|nr:Drebrin-like protein [Cladorrhinum sp. PSN259]
MASLNTSINGPSIKSSYQGVINGPALAVGSPTAARWALFSVQAPLLNAFQNTGAKESILKVESTGEGELADLIEDFNEGRIQFAFVRVKDPNSGLPKNVLIAWCGGGVPERTKGYFTSHSAAVAKILTGYHVQITARSDADLEPESIVQKVADASGAKYSAGGSAPTPAVAGPPPVAKKPVFTPTASSSGSSFNPLVASRTRRQENTDDDGWGADAPPVSRTQIEKVESAYKPTKVDIASLRSNRDDSRYNGPAKSDDGPSDVVKGGYQPVGKIDIAALRAQAKAQDDRPTIVKGAYEPVGKVDIAAIRSRSQKPVEQEEEPAAPKSLAERTAAFSQSERLTELPKPKVAKKFGATPFTGTKAPAPGGLGYGAASVPTPPPVGAASRTFADQGGKTPAQLWAEKKAKQAGGVTASSASPSPAPAITAQKSGSEWKSGYAGKSWAPVSTSNFGRGGVEKHSTGGTERSETEHEREAPASPAGGISAIRDRFKDAAPMGTATRSTPAVPSHSDEPAPPPPMASRPPGGFALPGLPSRPPAADQDEEEEEAPVIPSRNYEEREQSPPRIAVPVARSNVPEIEPAVQRLPPRLIPVPEDLPKEEELPAEDETQDPRAAAAGVAALASDAVEHATDVASGATGGKRALVQFDYERAEDNEIELREGEYVINIEMVDEDWWMGTNAQGQSGLFPSNYVELVDDESTAAPVAAAPAAREAAAAPSPVPAAQSQPEPAGADGKTATAQFDYEAAEDNELSFPEGAVITNLDFPDEDWWFGHYKGQQGLFPANYVVLDS